MFSITHSVIQNPHPFGAKKKKHVILPSKSSSKVPVPVRIAQFSVLSSGVSEDFQKTGNFSVHRRYPFSAFIVCYLSRGSKIM